jgi:uncharacterized protein YceK
VRKRGLGSAWRGGGAERASGRRGLGGRGKRYEGRELVLLLVLVSVVLVLVLVVSVVLVLVVLVLSLCMTVASRVAHKQGEHGQEGQYKLQRP